MLRKLVLPVAAVALLAAPTAGSATAPPGDALTAEELAAAAERSANTSYRFEMLMTVTGLPMFEIDGPLASGEFTGKRMHMRMDLGVVFASLLDMPGAPPEVQELRDADLTMEMILDGTDIYVRAPFFATLAEMMGPEAGSFEVFAELGDGWGYVDLTRLEGTELGDITEAVGGMGGDPLSFFALLSDIGKTEQLGSETIRGVESVGVRAHVDFGELMEVQGAPVDLPAGDLENLANVTFPIDVWVGSDGYISRVAFTFDSETMAQAAEDSDIDEPALDMLGEFEMTMAMEMFDYADPAIVVEPPTEFTDIDRKSVV